jgi:hypothetical protein
MTRISITLLFSLERFPKQKLGVLAVLESKALSSIILFNVYFEDFFELRSIVSSGSTADVQTTIKLPNFNGWYGEAK